MEASREEKVRLGIFVTIVMVLFILFIAYLLGREFFQPTKRYYTIFSESVDGLNVSAKVKLNGVNIGQVTRIEVDTNDVNNVVVWYEVQSSTPIKPDMQAVLMGGISITGLKTIEIQGGTNELANLPEKSLIPEGASGFKVMTGQAETILLKTEQLMNNLLSITKPSTVDHFSRTIASMQSLTATADTIIRTNRDALLTAPTTLNHILESTSELSALASDLFRELNEHKPAQRLGSVLTQTDSIMHILRSKLESFPLEESAQKFIETADVISSLAGRTDILLLRIQDDLTSTMKELRETMENLNDFSRMIQENPSVLLRG
jgi:phospholipid/cholesterol/gamma-HCH transport system substrate-binding protein